MRRLSWQNVASAFRVRRDPPVSADTVLLVSVDPHRVNPAPAGSHRPAPLRFNPGKLDGFSERLIRSHWENDYLGAVKALNMIEARIANALTDPDLPSAVCWIMSGSCALRRTVSEALR